MATYVQHTKNILADKAPNFMELNNINCASTQQHLSRCHSQPIFAHFPSSLSLLCVYEINLGSTSGPTLGASGEIPAYERPARVAIYSHACRGRLHLEAAAPYTDLLFNFFYICIYISMLLPSLPPPHMCALPWMQHRPLTLQMR